MNLLTSRSPRLLWLTSHRFDTVKKGQLFLPSTQRSYLRSPWLSATIVVFNLLMQCTPPYSSSKGSSTLLTFWREPLPVGISSTTTSHVGTPSLRYRHTTIQLVASVTLHASLYPATSHSKPLRLPILSLCSRSRLKALNRRATMIAECPSSKKRAVAIRLLASQQVSREVEGLHGTGLYKNIPGKLQHCSRCNQKGHNVLRCPANPAGL